MADTSDSEVSKGMVSPEPTFLEGRAVTCGIFERVDERNLLRRYALAANVWGVVLMCAVTAEPGQMTLAIPLHSA